ncbi:MAG: hypothetical protein LRY50_04810 [Geovibrio sp.]|uniref:hypothetical protein n=1 Tax=Geovibrio ferrireducens TaxID=46201 RepID=UPI002245EB94|nr:hypothetical protein [Geovibrio ferrireducens]MCD8491941.1 hypothetical protein [Geovibrio sp.]MCD8567680.1 hypothetical protein [Geovibrio sp.]
MKLSAPKFITWLLGTFLGVLGLLIYFGVVSISVMTFSPFWLVVAGFGILAAAPLFSGL